MEPEQFTTDKFLEEYYETNKVRQVKLSLTEEQIVDFCVKTYELKGGRLPPGVRIVTRIYEPDLSSITFFLEHEMFEEVRQDHIPNWSVRWFHPELVEALEDNNARR